LRIHILSDLHNEFRVLSGYGAEADVTVLAGDIDIGEKGFAWARSVFAGRPVVYVAGNHEYYGHAMPSLTKKLLREKDPGNVTFLECTDVTIGGMRFLGCTLWSDFDIVGDRAESMQVSYERMNDYQKIRVSPRYRRLRPKDTALRNAASCRWLKAEVGKDPARTVVVTHHAPSVRSLNPDFSFDPVSGAYASDLEEFIAETRPALWIHGHTHYCVDYTIGTTRIISNQRGYPHMPVSGFDPGLVVEAGT
jgi:Icc-related predicted phosphoesterase